MENWIKQFEKEFEIKKSNNNEYKIIIGFRPYLQKLGTKELRVDISNETNKFYKNFNTVAFLVNDWIKIQDSLEMIFNLLTVDSSKSLNILAYLRTHKKVITPIKFMEYLLNKHKLILINKYEDNICKSSDIIELIKTINTQEKTTANILFIGDNQFYQGIEKQNPTGYVFHSSGVNLNKNPVDYEKLWYKFDQALVKNNSSNKAVNLTCFNVLK